MKSLIDNSLCPNIKKVKNNIKIRITTRLKYYYHDNNKQTANEYQYDSLGPDDNAKKRHSTFIFTNFTAFF